ncbi:MAG: tyrosine-type recombinase/integrase, partial [Planctomycetes bacterium]|nr:tyrosine-type recombinase/integrase [Planctomycetota bacterium]
MATIRKRTYTLAIPKEAKIVTKRGEKFARLTRKNRSVDAPLTADGSKCRMETECWYVRYKDAAGVWQEEKGYTDKAATLAKAVETEKRVAHEQEGIVDRYTEQFKKPLVDHLDDFRQELAGQWSKKHVSLVVTKARNLLTAESFTAQIGRQEDWGGKWPEMKGCNFRRIGDLDANAVAVRISALQQAGMSIQTAKHYLSACQQFCRWLVTNRRAPDNPLSHLKPGDPELDRRRERRALTPDEIERLLKATQASNKTFRGFDGNDRFVIYCVALGTGFRVSEIASLTPASFDLGELPIVSLVPTVSKRRKQDEQPLPPDVAELVRGYIADRKPRKRLWPGSWKDRAADMLQIDLEAANIPYVDDSGRYADFHGNRHTYITTVCRTLRSSKMAQKLARHSSSALTERFTHLEIHDTGAAAAELPPIIPEVAADEQQLEATGTDDRTAASSHLCPHPSQNSVIKGHFEAQPGKVQCSGVVLPPKSQSVTMARVGTTMHDGTHTGWVAEWTKAAVLKTAVR